MLGFLKGLVSSDKIVNGGMSAMDKLLLTPEERLDYKLKFIAATMPMNRARRFITLTITGIWATHTWVALMLFLAESEKFVEFANYMTMNISAQFAIVVAFYYYNGKKKEI